MNYQKIHDAIINRARYRPVPSGYTERHHIKPRCMGGTDDADNLVYLTPEEHYIIHLLLTKIYPNDIKLSYAAIKMTVKPKTKICNRNNKLYGWLKRKHAKNISLSQTGKIYYNNGIKNIKLFPGEPIPDGFIKGRNYSPTKGLKLSYESDNFKNNKLQSELANRRWDRENLKLAKKFGCETFEDALKIFSEFKNKQHFKFWIKPTIEKFPFLSRTTARRLNKLVSVSD